MSKLSPRKLKPKIRMNEECDLVIDVDGIEYSGTVVFTDIAIQRDEDYEDPHFDYIGNAFYRNFRPINTSIDLTARVIGQMTRVQR